MKVINIMLLHILMSILLVSCNIDKPQEQGNFTNETLRETTNCITSTVSSLKENDSSSREETDSTNVSLPKIEDFSGTEYEDYEYHFSPAKSAELICGDKITEISPDDPRLIRLLNFLIFGVQEHYTYWRQGYVLEDEINDYLASPAPKLKVYFDTTESNPEWRDTPEIIISGNTYLLMLSTEDAEYHGERIMAEQYFAYQEFMFEEADPSLKHKLDESSLLEQWSNPELYWLDLIEYAGFIVE